MIVSASRRTDIPAYYSDWFLGRVRAGYCLVRNPFDARRERRVSLEPAEVDYIVFWTRDSRPLAPRLDELDGLGLRYYFQFTITGYPPSIEPGSPPAGESIEALSELADLVGPDRALWRYDPILVAAGLDADWHRRNFTRLAAALEGRTRRVAFSLLDEYAPTAARLGRAGHPGAVFGSPRGPARPDGARGDEVAQRSLFPGPPPEPYPALLAELAATALSQGMRPVACAEPYDLSSLGVEAGACVDAALARGLWGLEVAAAKDPGQRPGCRCAPSVDVGAYGTCPRGCAYCYARRGAAVLLARGPSDEML
jgi:hypothetical protein